MCEAGQVGLHLSFKDSWWLCCTEVKSLDTYTLCTLAPILRSKMTLSILMPILNIKQYTYNTVFKHLTCYCIYTHLLLFSPSCYSFLQRQHSLLRLIAWAIKTHPHRNRKNWNKMLNLYHWRRLTGLEFTLGRRRVTQCAALKSFVSLQMQKQKNYTFFFCSRIWMQSSKAKQRDHNSTIIVRIWDILLHSLRWREKKHYRYVWKTMWKFYRWWNILTKALWLSESHQILVV